MCNFLRQFQYLPLFFLFSISILSSSIFSSLRARISTIEATEGILHVESLLAKSPEMQAQLEQAHEAHRRDFIAKGGDPNLEAGAVI